MAEINPTFRDRLFLAGTVLLICDSLLFVLLELMISHSRSAISVNKHAASLLIGAAAGALGFVLVLFGREWKRWLFAVIAFVEFYVFFSALLWMVQTT